MTYITNKDYFHEVSRGNVPGSIALNKFAENDDVDSGAIETLWGVGGTWVPTTADRIMDISSASVQDTSAGVGLRTLNLSGISGGNVTSEVVIMNGTTNVPTVNAYSTIHRMQIETSGSSNINSGDITAVAQVDGTTQGQISQDKGTTEQLIGQCPAGHQMHILGHSFNVYQVSGGGSATVDFELWIILEDGSEFRVFRERSEISNSNRAGNPKELVSNPYPALSRFDVRVDSDTNNVGMQGRLWIVFEQI